MTAKRKPLNQAADARTLAVRVLNALESPGARRTLDDLLAEVEGLTAVRLRRDRALLNAIVFGVLRARGRLDHILSRLSKIPWSKVDLPVKNVLRVGLFQMTDLSRIPASAAVNTSVDIARAGTAPHAAAFVNAVLRKAAAAHAAIPFPDPMADRIRARAVCGSLPEWLAARWLDRYGAEKADALIAAVNAIPPLTLRVNTLRAGRPELIAALANEAERVEPSAVAPDGVLVWGLERHLTATQPFREGWFQVQDEAAQLVGLLLDPRPGEAVLDACAGRGGKTGHLAQLMRDQGRLTAVDRHPGRLEQLAGELKRLGIRSASALPWDWEGAAPPDALGRFDRVLLDAPCSGLGTLRRNPDIRWRASESELARHGRIQGRLLERAAACVKPGGTLVYAVCSPEPEETTAVVEAFLERHPEFRRARDPSGFQAALHPFLDASGALQTHPAAGYMDGFFAVKLEMRTQLKKEAP
jgi:16S rRNA (cytosine967-C5)-methyltransferase